MELPPVVLIDDSLRSGAMLAPITDLRPAFDIRTGALTLLERLERVLGVPIASCIVPDSLGALTRDRFPQLKVNQPETARGSVLAINASTARIDHDALRSLINSGGHGRLVDGADQTLAAILPASHLAQPDKFAWGDAPVAARASSPLTLTRPWHVRTFRDACILEDLRLIAAHIIKSRGSLNNAPPGATVIPNHHSTLAIAASASVFPGCIIDLSQGSVVIDDHAVVRPGAIIIGPAYVGPHSSVLERATIRPFTAIGPWCKVNGEVGGTIFQGFANKAHDGYLGDSYVGEWVNLGAGTTNSNLLNTYAEIIARPLPAPTAVATAVAPAGAPPATSNERTGEQFLGCTLGDHVKTAICSRIMTGAIVGTGCMFAASTPLAGTIPAFSWITDSGTRSYRFDKFLEVARAAMARRSIEPATSYIERLRALACTPNSAYTAGNLISDP